MWRKRRVERKPIGQNLRRFTSGRPGRGPAKDCLPQPQGVAGEEAQAEAEGAAAGEAEAAQAKLRTLHDAAQALCGAGHVGEAALAPLPVYEAVLGDLEALGLVFLHPGVQIPDKEADVVEAPAGFWARYRL